MPTRTWVALLRAVNLGARNKVPMAGLRALLTAQGCEDVRTYIQSGNAVFSSATAKAELQRRLEQAIQEAFGVETPVILRTAEELACVVDGHPFGADASLTHVAFLAEKPSAARAKALAALEVEPDRVAVRGADVYWHLPNGVQGARLSGARLEKELGVAATIRNWRTVAGLAQMAAER